MPIKAPKLVRALVDTGASHNFVSVEEARRMRLNITKGGGSLKAVNSAAKPIEGVAKEVRASIGEWTGTIDLSVVPMDDFQLVLGMEFLDKVTAFPLPFANTVCIIDGENTCMVPIERSKQIETITAMQFKKGYRRG